MRQWKKKMRSLGEVLFLGIIGIPVGIIVGILDTIFGKVLLKISEIRTEYPLYLIPFLAVAGVIIVFFYQRFGGKSGKGMYLIFQAGHEENTLIPFRLVPFSMVGTWLTHLCGGSAGREGVAVQIGGAIFHTIGRKLPIAQAPKIMLVAGMAAGFSGLFQTPIAAIFFALEVLAAGKMEYAALFPTFTASFAACTTSSKLGLEKFSIILNTEIPAVPITFVKLILLGILFGIAGGAFAWCLNRSKKLAKEKLPNPILRIAVFGICLSILFLLLHCGRYCGLGTNLIAAGFNGETIYFYDWILKWILTILTLTAGFQGGEVTPLFSIGTCMGVFLAPILHLPPEFAAAMGYACVFGSATNTFLAPMLIGAEVFGFSNFPYFFVVCTIGYLCNRNHSIYELQKKIGSRSAILK